MIGRLWRGVVLSMLIAAAAASHAHAAGITEFSNGLGAGSNPQAPTGGPDGNVWFVDSHSIGRITPSGAITEYGQLNGLNPGSMPFDMVLGSDGNLWFSDDGTTKAIGRITPSGAITEYGQLNGLNPGSVPENVVLGPDGNVWFLDLGTTKAIGRITPAGTIDEHSSGLNPMSQPNAITAGPDGNLWLTDQGNTRGIGRVTPAGAIHEFSSPDPLNSFPNDITAGADGNVWFSDDGTPAVGRVKPDGTIDEFNSSNSALNSSSQPDSLTAGPDGNVWFADQYAAQRAIGRITPAGTVTEFHSGLNTSLPGELTIGADANLWLPQSMDGGVARVTTAGAISEFTAGLNPGSGSETDGMVSGPDGNLWFTDDGATKAIGKVALQLAPTASTGSASAVSKSSATVSGSVDPLGAATTVAFQYGKTPALGSTAAAGSLAASGDTAPVHAALTKLPSGTVIDYRVVATNAFGTTHGPVHTFKTAGTPPAPPAPRPKLTTRTFGNQHITLATPSSCTAKTKTLSVTLGSVAVRKSHATKLRFASAAFYLDKGIRHRHKKTKRSRTGRKKTVIVTTYTANAVARHVPAKLRLRLKGLSSRTHSLKVVMSYKKTVSKHRHKTTVRVTKTLTVRFRVC